MSENKEKHNDIVKEIAKDVYSDVGHPVAQPTGELVGLVPRAIKAALAPLEQWVLQREYNVAETKKLLESKLKDVPPELIEAPDAHIAVPALQYISYCMDNDELRDMYANLLASSMNKIVKNNVHPGFVDIIKQLCPDEAKIMKYLYSHHTAPTVTLRYEDEHGGGVSIFKNFSNIGELTGCEQPLEINKYFDNLKRLGLIENAEVLSSLTDKAKYEPLRTHPLITAGLEGISRQTKFSKSRLSESYVTISDYGKAFCSICLNPVKIAVTQQDT